MADKENSIKASGFSPKAMVAGVGILLVFVFTIIFALHKKAEQQNVPNKKGVASEAVSGVINSVASPGDAAPPPPAAVPSFVEDIPNAKPVAGNVQAAASGTQTEAQKQLAKELDDKRKEWLASAKSPLKMNVESDYEPKQKVVLGPNPNGLPGPDTTAQAIDSLQAQIASMKKAQQSGDHSADKQLAAEQAMLASIMKSNNGGGSQGGGGGFGGGMPGYGMGMGGMGMPTMQATNPTPTQIAKQENQWQAKQDKPVKTQFIKVKVEKPETNYFLTGGTLIPAVLTREINTSSPGTAEAIVTADIYNNAPGHENEILIPANSKITGTYNNSVQFGQKRVQAVWKEIELPDGRSFPIVGEGADMSGQAGLKDQVDNHYLKLFEGVMLMSVFDAGPMLATPGQSTSQLNGGAVESTMGQSVGMNASSVGMEFTSNMLNLAPTITIRNAVPFNIVVPQTMVFDTYYSLIGDKK